MNSGVYCRPQSTTTVYNSIIIDRFNKIFGDPPKESSVKPPENMDSLGPSSDCTNSSEEEKWNCGMNVRAPFAVDGEYYEATIEKIFDEYAVVRFLGYDNEEAIKLKDLRPSLGEESITEQIEKATEERNDEENEMGDDEYEDEDEIEWKVGMSCRALYEPNEVVYEAVIQEVSQKDRKAVVIMSGYGIPYEVSFEHMYESMPELRIKQETSARNYIAQKAKSQDNELQSSDVPNPGKSSGVGDINTSENRNETLPPLNARRIHPPPELSNINPANVPTCGFSSCQGMMQPQSENDALACLVSSTYLSGYYAGYYDCMKKHQSSNH